MKKMHLILVLTVVFLISGCEQNNIDDDFKRKGESLMELKDKYGLRDIKVVSDPSSIPPERIYSIEKVGHILEQLKKLKGEKIPIKLKKSFKTKSYAYDTYQYAIVGANSTLTAIVFLDLEQRRVEGSEVSFNLPTSLYLTYRHSGGICRGGEITPRMYFSAYGVVTFYIAIENIVVSTHIVKIDGYYDFLLGDGELTFF